MVELSDKFIPDSDNPKDYLKSLLTLKNKMDENGFSLVYEGIIDHSIIKAFTSLTETKMSALDEELRVKKKVFNVMVECLQNISMHTEESFNDDPFLNLFGNGIFIVGKVNGKYNIVTGNFLEDRSVEPLKGVLERIKELDLNELKVLHREKLKESQISNKGGAGLGLIEIAKKSEGNIDYNFIPYKHDHSFFILRTEIS